MINEKYKNLIIILLLAVFLGACAVIFYLTKDKEEVLSMTGEVIIADANYIIIESGNEDYLINNIKGSYSVGDTIKLKYKNSDLNTKSSPKTIKISDEELIKAYEKEEIEDNNKPPVNEEINNSNETKADTVVLNYVEDLKNDFDASSIKSSLRNSFITVVDFLFYNGKIKGYTFNELSSSAKLKVLSMALYFDSKIEKYFPGYKESITSTTNKIYTNVKEKIVTAYLNITTSICASNTELCIKAKEGFQDLKTNFNLTWSLIKDIAGDGLTNLKNWYEIWSEK